MNNPNKYPNLILGIGGYSVDFNNLSKEQQQEILSRTIHEKI
jgi:formate C-acetyltransferase